MSNIFFVRTKGPQKTIFYPNSALAVVRFYTVMKCISQQPVSYWYDKE